MKYIAIFFAIILVLAYLYHLLVVYARKFYERIRDNADIESDGFLINGCNQALDEINATHMYYRRIINKIARWFK